MSGGCLRSAIPQSHNCAKVYIQRDYSNGTVVRFQNNVPPELTDKIERAVFEYTVNQLNGYFEQAERGNCSTYCEGCFACLTVYLMFICSETHYEKSLKKVAKFVMEQNEKVYLPRGLLLVNPAERGLRVIEIAILDQPMLPRA